VSASWAAAVWVPGVARGFVLAGATVVVVERDQHSAAAARERVERSMAKSLERGAFEGKLDELTGHFSVSTDYASFAGCGLVVEAVPEDMEMKVAARTAVEARLGDGAWLTTNTSSLSVTALARTLRRPERFCGLHFFIPVPASLLVEVVRAKTTAAELAGLARQWVEALGTTRVVVNDAPGFVSSRLGVAITLEAIRMVEAGVASVEDIDAAMVLGYSCHGPGLQVPRGTTSADGHRGPGRQAGNRRVPALRPGRAVRPTAAHAEHGGPRPARPQIRQRFL